MTEQCQCQCQLKAVCVVKCELNLLMDIKWLCAKIYMSKSRLRIQHTAQTHFIMYYEEHGVNGMYDISLVPRSILRDKITGREQGTIRCSRDEFCIYRNARYRDVDLLTKNILVGYWSSNIGAESCKNV